MKALYHLIILLCVLSVASCRDDFDFESATGSELTFSKDTVYLDTIFTNIGSSTYNLKVYNKSNKDIKIPLIRLAKGENSNFRLMVDGLSGKNFENVELLAKDSLFIFVETTVDIIQETQNNEFLYTDEILFQAGANQHKVNLVTLVRDAIFLYPQKFQDGTYEYLNINDDKIYGFFLDDKDPVNGNELEWNNKKPYVIYGYAAVPPNKTLNINEGTQVHFHRNSALLAYPNSQINAIGSIENLISFQGNRLEPSFENTEGQWDMILLAENSKASFKNVLIKNATIGLNVNANNNVVNLENVQIYNCSNYGILGYKSKITGKNIVTNNIGKAALALTQGGTYDFTHCTFSNYYSRQNQTAVIIDNGTGSNEFAVQAHFKNSIIYGNTGESLLLNAAANSSTFTAKFDNCLIKFFNTGNRFPTTFPYDFSNTTYFNNCIIAKNSYENQPYFFNVPKNEMMITDKATSIIGFGNTVFAQNIPLDIIGKNRTSNPDLGAYQHVNSVQD